MFIFILINLKLLITFLMMKMTIESHVKCKWAPAILLGRKSFWVSGDFWSPGGKEMETEGRYRERKSESEDCR